KAPLTPPSHPKVCQLHLIFQRILKSPTPKPHARRSRDQSFQLIPQRMNPLLLQPPARLSNSSPNSWKLAPPTAPSLPKTPKSSDATSKNSSSKVQPQFRLSVSSSTNKSNTTSPMSPEANKWDTSHCGQV